MSSEARRSASSRTRESIRPERIDGREVLTSDGPLAIGMTLSIGGDTLYSVSGDSAACSELIAALP